MNSVPLALIGKPGSRRYTTALPIDLSAGDAQIQDGKTFAETLTQKAVQCRTQKPRDGVLKKLCRLAKALAR